jgi:hypothetical protein
MKRVGLNLDEDQRRSADGRGYIRFEGRRTPSLAYVSLSRFAVFGVGLAARILRCSEYGATMNY